MVGIKDRETNQIAAKVVQSTDAPTLQGFVVDQTDVQATVYTDEHAGYRGMGRKHEAVKHSAKEYVHGMAHTNGIESHWAMLKRGYVGTYHQMSTKPPGPLCQRVLRSPQPAANEHFGTNDGNR